MAKIWAILLHLSFDMWADRKVDKWDNFKRRHLDYLSAAPHLRFDQRLWDDVTERMAGVGMNMVVIDLGDAVKYKSHPEIAVQGAWTREKLRKELARLRKLGLEPIPKMNFSTGHDAWLGVYARQVSTPVYYKVCTDLIHEAADLFERPRFFHIGYDEETAGNQTQYAYMVVRQHELWWHDFFFFVEQIEDRGCRPWMWSDFAWGNHDAFYKRVPRSVLQSNWWYWPDWNSRKLSAVRNFTELEKHKYDQIPTGANWIERENFGKLVKYCTQRVDPKRLLGFLQTVWFPTVECYRKRHMEAVDVVGEAIRAWHGHLASV
jgi:hypothetical protein